MILGTMFMLFPVFIQAQLYIGENVHVKEGTTLHVQSDIILDTDEITGKGEIVLSGDEKQEVIVKRKQTKIARISINNKKGVEVKGKGHLVIKKDIYVAKGSSFSGKYLGNILSKGKEVIPTQLASKTNKEKIPEVEKEFIPEILGYGFIINIREVLSKTSSSSAKGLSSTTMNSVVVAKQDFINLPLINNYYTKRLSEYYYTQTYEDEDFSNIFAPPKIG